MANVSRRFSQILVALAENRKSLTVAGLLAPVLTESSVDALLVGCAGMTKREAEEYLVALRPNPVFASSIRRTPSRPQRGPLALTSPPSVQTAPPDKTPPVHEAWAGRPAFRTSPSILEPARPEIYNFRFASDRKFKEKFERLREAKRSDKTPRKKSRLDEIPSGEEKANSLHPFRTSDSGYPISIPSTSSNLALIPQPPKLSVTAIQSSFLPSSSGRYNSSKSPTVPKKR